MKWLLIFSIFFLVSCDRVFDYIKGGEVSQDNRLQVFKQKKWNVKQPVKVHWLKYAVPYIRAQNDEDLFYATGVIHAHLRGAQLELFRRTSQGRVSELIGVKGIKIDKLLRTIDFGKAYESVEQKMPDKYKVYRNRYLEGLNDYFKQVKVLPFDLKMMGIKQIEPWSKKELFTLHRLLGLDINWKLWVHQLKSKNEKEVVDYEYFWKKWVLPKFTNQAFKDLDKIDQFTESGSNAYALSGKVTKNKFPIVAGDPHLGISIPNFWFFLYQESPNFKTLGVTMPGIPIPVMGRTPYLAWTGTNMWATSSYLYKLDIQDVKKAKKRKETLKVRFGRDIEFEVLDTEYGPIISDTKFFESKEPLALFWSGHRDSVEFEAFVKSNQAKNIKEFKEAFINYGVLALNYVVADKEGNISKIHVTNHPVPQKKTVNFILDTDNKITKYKNVMSLPEDKNPKRGWVSSANEPIKNENICFFCSTYGRVNRINELLSEKAPNITVEDIKSIQQDIFLKEAKGFLSDIKTIYAESKVGLPDKIQNMNWNYKYEVTSTEAYIFEKFFKILSQEVFTTKGFSKAQRDTLYSHITWKRKSLKMLKNFSRSSLASTLRKVNKKMEKIKEKTWGDVHKLVLGHPFSNLPVIGKYFSVYVGPYPGAEGTVFKAAFDAKSNNYKVDFGANLRVIFDFSAEDENYGVLLGGQDGYFGSECETNQLDMWLAGKYMKLPFKVDSIKKETKTLIELTNPRK